MTKNKRIFNVAKHRLDDMTGLGLREMCDKDGKETVAIWSLYYDTCLSHRDMLVEAYQIVWNRLEGDETAEITAVNMRRKIEWIRPYESKLTSIGRPYLEYFRDNKNLAVDATERKSTIKEEM